MKSRRKEFVYLDDTSVVGRVDGLRCSGGVSNDILWWAGEGAINITEERLAFKVVGHQVLS
jgi:hypothetical protein